MVEYFYLSVLAKGEIHNPSLSAISSTVLLSLCLTERDNTAKVGGYMA